VGFKPGFKTVLFKKKNVFETEKTLLGAKKIKKGSKYVQNSVK
jgi:hypothetical protein